MLFHFHKTVYLRRQPEVSDNLLSQFGKDAPAIGFMIVVDDLLSAMSRQGVIISGMEQCEKLYYTESTFKEQLKAAKRMRAEGKHVELVPRM